MLIPNHLKKSKNSNTKNYGEMDMLRTIKKKYFLNSIPRRFEVYYDFCLKPKLKLNAVYYILLLHLLLVQYFSGNSSIHVR